MKQNHYQLHFLATLLVLLASITQIDAKASCIVPPDKTSVVTIDKSHAPVYDGSGIKHPGCILESKGHILGYTAYNYLCKLSPKEKINVRFSYGCCDTGPDSGDLVCTVRAKYLWGVTSVHGNGVAVSPAKMDIRAIDDLMSTLQGDYPFSYYGASSKLLAYLADAKYRAAVIARRKQLKETASHGKTLDQRGYAANVLLHMGHANDAETVLQIIRVIEMEPVFDDIAIFAIQKAGNYPKYVDQIAPALLRFLKRKYYNKNQAQATLATLEKFGKALRPYLKDLLRYEYEWSDRGEYYNFDQRIPFRKKMNKIVCGISSKDTNTLQRDEAKGNPEYKAIQFTCPPKN